MRKRSNATPRSILFSVIIILLTASALATYFYTGLLQVILQIFVILLAAFTLIILHRFSEHEFLKFLVASTTILALIYTFLEQYKDCTLVALIVSTVLTLVFLRTSNTPRVEVIRNR